MTVARVIRATRFGARLLLAYVASVAGGGVAFAVVLRVVDVVEGSSTSRHMAEDAAVRFLFFCVFAFFLAALPFALMIGVARLLRRSGLSASILAGGSTGVAMIPLVLSGNWHPSSVGYDAGVAATMIVPGLVAGASAWCAFAYFGPRAADASMGGHGVWRRPSRLLLAGSLVFACYAAWRTEVGEAPWGPPRPIHVQLDETVAAFIEINKIATARHDEAEAVNVDLDQVKDDRPIVFAQTWLAPTFEDGTGSVALPPADMIWIGQSAGQITECTFYLGFELRPFAEASARADALIATLAARGWTSAYPIIHVATPADLRSNKIVAQMHDAVGNVAEILVAGPSDADASGAHWRVHFGVYSAEEPERSMLVDARRLFTFGSSGRELPLRAWVEDPDWSPRAHGMTFVVPIGRTHGEWAMPKPPAEPR